MTAPAKRPTLEGRPVVYASSGRLRGVQSGRTWLADPVEIAQTRRCLEAERGPR
jgi:hypothetical protein